ncbi:TonB-dependent receptor domain-containing protein [Novosphingobium decolorationis]|uniref:TonB-dependent receptor n=1 Tax=Novosphingobium decolorationis TaxID=2698673 RepID=A0ABX8E2L3_9SPHN|nr:TonB-dependent receptor [Novosphingobium decolorationis]QVM83371.1 TonB-dependent receptor [Novosphingobium decolorationis]
MKTNIMRTALIGATCLTTVALSATPVLAQDSTAPAAEIVGEEIIVMTGSRIARTNADTYEPSIIIDSELLQKRGLTNIADALSTVPAFGTPGASPTGGQGGSFGSGQSFINFFGLGSQRTLTLVNSRRFVSSNTASIFGPSAAGSQVDLNTLPTLALDRIETIAVGGAPIYGADAIAGTVNILLKQDYEGIELNAQTGLSKRGDGANHRLGALAGTSFGGGRGHIVGAFEYNRTEGMTYEARKRTAAGLFYTSPIEDSPYSQVIIEDRRIPALSPYGLPTTIDIIPGDLGPLGAPGLNYGILDAQGNTLGFDRNGNLAPIDFGTVHGATASAGGNGMSLVPLSNLLSPVERYLGYAHADYELTDGIKATVDFNYARSKGTELRTQPVYNTWLFGDAGDPDGNLIIPLSNPFLSDAARQTIAAQLPEGQDVFYLGRANTDLVSGRGSSTVELYRITGGLEGDFNVAGRDISWEVIGNYGRSKTRGSSRELVQQNFENALAGCQDGYTNSPIQTGSATCVPFNPFGNQNGPEVGEYITTTAHPTALNEQWMVTADITGTLFDLPAGGVGFALGYEHRNEKSDFDPGAFFYGAVDPNDPDGARTQYGRSIPIDPVRGSYHTNEVFGELQVPLISPDMNVPFLYSAELHGAGRYVDNSLAGGDLTWTAGGKVNFLKDFGIRGNFTRSIRAPAITELYNPTSQIFTTADDPCDARFITAGPNPANRAANCAADGLPADFTSNIVDFTSRGSLSGNTSLENETADSWTIGGIFTPTFLPGFSLAVDWVSVNLKNAIVSVDADGTLEACYDATSFPSAACDQIDRDADGQVEFIRTGYLNAASYKYKGLIGELHYFTETPFLGANSAIQLGASYQYIDTLETRIGTGDLSTSRGSIGYSKHQFTVNASYMNGPFTAYTQVQYIGKAERDPDASANTYEYPTRPAVAFVNSSISYDINEDYTLRLMVDNVFDTNAPYPAPAGGGLDTYWSGFMGRYYKVGVTARF